MRLALLRRSALLVLLVIASSASAGESLRPWRDYRTILWISDSAYQNPAHTSAFFDRLKEMGINTGMVVGDSDPNRMRDHHFDYYVENIVNRGLCLKWNSNVRDWSQFVNKWNVSGRGEKAFVRDYCLDDPKYVESAKSQMAAAARIHAPYHPIALNIRDELSVTLSANPFDYDFNPIAIQAFQKWLETQYPTLKALNQEWDTSFSSWQEVRPFTTDQIKNRFGGGGRQPRGKPDWQAVARTRFDPIEARKDLVRWNFSPWADFRTYQDVSLARALAAMVAAAHQVDPQTPVGIEGTQMPSAFGGYDLWRLSQAVEWIEPYDLGNAREIFGSFMPGGPMLSTVAAGDTPHALRQLWHLLLEGDRGCIVWWSQDTIDTTRDGCPLTDKGNALAPVLKEMTGPLARLFLDAKPVFDPIVLIYSQPSIQVDWMIESAEDGQTWVRRFSSYEAGHNRQAKVRNAWLKALQDAGFSPRFMASEQVETKGLGDASVVVLPCAWAMSDKEAATVRQWSKKPGHVLLCDGMPGFFDQHGKLRDRAVFQDNVATSVTSEKSFAHHGDGQPSTHDGDIAAYADLRLQASPDMHWQAWIASQLPMKPAVAIEPPDARLRVHRYRLDHFPGAMLLAFERNIQPATGEDLKMAEINGGLEQPVEAKAQLPRAFHVYDLNKQKYLGQMDKIQFSQDPWRPSLFALLPEKIPLERLMQTQP